jgi:DnaJ-domain-containing protein 1
VASTPSSLGTRIANLPLKSFKAIQPKREHMKSINEYRKILGVDSSVTAEELKKVYRELVKEWHPDRLLHNPSLHKTAQQRLQEINEAYDQLQAHFARVMKW